MIKRSKNYVKTTLKLTALAVTAVALGISLSNSLVNADPLGQHENNIKLSNEQNNGNNQLNSNTQTCSTSHLNDIISRGTDEINRRLTNLNNELSNISASTKISSTDKTNLTTEVNTTITGLQSLETQLKSETTCSSAISDVQNIFLEYRVYALVDPKIRFVKVVSDQLTIESNLTNLATKLQTRINSAASGGKDVTTMVSELADMQSQINAAQTLSNSIETAILPLQPSDYNSNHQLLETYKTQLQQAKTDIQAAVSDAKNIISDLKSLNN